MKKIYFAFLVMMATLGTTLAQGPTFVISNTAGDPGSVVSVDFAVKDFDNLIGMQFSVNWDANVLQFKELKNVTSALRDFDEGAFNLDPRFVDDGKIVVQWFDNSLEANSLDSGTIVFTLDFDVVGAAGEGTTITISDDPRKIEIVNAEEMNVGLDQEGGVFGTGGDNGGGSLRIIGSDVEGAMGDDVCVEVTVDGFTDVAGMQFSLNWDAAFLEFVGVGDFNLSGLNEGTFNLDDVANGKAVVQWLDPDSEGEELANGTKIFEICFTILGSTGNRPITFSNDPLPIEFVDSDDMRINFTKKDGTVTVGSDGGGGRECEIEGFAMVISEETPQPNTEVCMDVSVKGFIDMLALGGTIEWDNAVLSNPRVQNFDLVGLSIGNFNLDQGANGLLSFVWTETTTDGLTLPDDQVIFEMCFDAIGANGTTTDVEITDGLTNREASNTSMVLEFGQCDGSVEVGGTGSVTVSTNITSPCPGESGGSIDVTVAGGTSPFSFSWSLGGNQISTSEDLANVSAGTYVLVVSDAGGAEIENTEIVVPDAIVISDSQITDAADGNANGSVDITVAGSGLQYSWSDGTMNEDLNNVMPGTFMVTITDANGCDLIETFTVGGTGGELDFSFEFDDYNGADISCFGECDASITAAATGGSGGYTFAWSSGETTASVTGVCAGEVSVTVTDSDGASISRNRMVVAPDELAVNVATTSSPNGTEGSALAEVTGGTESYTYRWNDADPPSTTRLISMLDRGSYTVIITDANGCQTSNTGVVGGTDSECGTGRLVITPNGDAKNDVLTIACTDGTDNELEIYNRHGELVFGMDNYDNSWQGTENDGDELPDGGYFWVLRVRNGQGLEQYVGHVTILRKLN